MFYKTENFFLKTAVLSLFQLRLVKHIFSKHRVQSKLSYFIMIFNYQHKKKKLKKNRSLDCSISLNNGEGGLYHDCAYRVTVDFDIKLHVVNNEAKHLKMNI